MADLYKYKVWCNDESAYFEVWSEDEPSSCPNNENHTIDTNKITIIEEKLEVLPTDRSGKQRVHETSRPLGLGTYFCGAGDDTDDITDVGGATTRFEIDHDTDGPDPEMVYMDFNIVENETWIHEGYVIWSDALFDCIDVEIVTRSCTVHEDSTAGTNYMVYPGAGIIVPSLTLGVPFGEGTCVIDNDILDPNGGMVFIPNNDQNEPPTAFWNADWNSTTKKYENLTPAPAGNGRYNIFHVEAVLARFVNKLPLLGSGFQKMQTADTDQLGQGMRFKLTAHTNGMHEWRASFVLTMYRDKTA